MFEFKPLGEIKKSYPVPPRILSYAREHANGNRYVADTGRHPITHWNVSMIIDTREGVYVLCNCDGAGPHPISDEYSEKVDEIAAKLNAEDDDSHVVDPNWLALDPNH